MATLELTSGGTLLEIVLDNNYVCTVSDLGVRIHDLETGVYVGHFDLSNITCGCSNRYGIFVGTSASGIYFLSKSNFTGDATALLVQTTTPTLDSASIVCMSGVGKKLLVCTDTGLELFHDSNDLTSKLAVVQAGVTHCDMTIDEIAYAASNSVYIVDMPITTWKLDYRHVLGSVSNPNAYSITEIPLTLAELGYASCEYSLSTGAFVSITTPGYFAQLFKITTSGIQHIGTMPATTTSYYTSAFPKANGDLVGGEGGAGRCWKLQGGTFVEISKYAASGGIYPNQALHHYLDDNNFLDIRSNLGYVTRGVFIEGQIATKANVDVSLLDDRQAAIGPYLVGADSAAAGDLRLSKFDGSNMVLADTYALDAGCRTVAFIGDKLYVQKVGESLLHAFNYHNDILEYLGTVSGGVDESLYPVLTNMHTDKFFISIGNTSGTDNKVYAFSSGGMTAIEVGLLTPADVTASFDITKVHYHNEFILVHYGAIDEFRCFKVEASVTPTVFSTITELKLGKDCFVAVQGEGVYAYDKETRETTLLYTPSLASLNSIAVSEEATATEGLLMFCTDNEQGIIDISNPEPAP